LKPDPNNLAFGDLYQLNIHQLQRQGRTGELLGKGAGTSTDFLDHRSYVAGDDIRRIDWRAFARTDQLLIKRFQEEIRPVVEIWVDGSASMKLTPEKAQLSVDIAAFFCQISRNAGVDYQFRVIGEGKSDPERVLLGEIAFENKESLEESLQRERHNIRRGAHVILLSDFISPHDPNRCIAGLMNRASTVTAIQIIALEDVEIEEGSSLLLEDSESGEVLEIDIDSATINEYLERFSRLQEDLDRVLNHWGGHFQIWSTGMDFREGLNQLLQRGVLLL